MHQTPSCGLLKSFRSQLLLVCLPLLLASCCCASHLLLLLITFISMTAVAQGQPPALLLMSPVVISRDKSCLIAKRCTSNYSPLWRNAHPVYLWFFLCCAVVTCFPLRTEASSSTSVSNPSASPGLYSSSSSSSNGLSSNSSSGSTGVSFHSSDGLSAGTIAGIVVGIVVGVCLCASIVWCRVRSTKEAEVNNIAKQGNSSAEMDYQEHHSTKSAQRPEEWKEEEKDNNEEKEVEEEEEEMEDQGEDIDQYKEATCTGNPPGLLPEDDSSDSGLWGLFERVERSGDSDLLKRWHVTELAFTGDSLTLTVDFKEVAAWETSWVQKLQAEMGAEFNCKPDLFNVILSHADENWKFLQALPVCSTNASLSESSSPHSPLELPSQASSTATTAPASPVASPTQHGSAVLISNDVVIEMNSLAPLHSAAGVISFLCEVHQATPAALPRPISSFRAVTDAHVVHKHSHGPPDDSMSPSLQHVSSKIPDRGKELNARLDKDFRKFERCNSRWLENKNNDIAQWWIPPSWHPHTRPQHGYAPLTVSQWGFFGIRALAEPKKMYEEGFLDVAISERLTPQSHHTLAPLLGQQAASWRLYEGTFKDLLGLVLQPVQYSRQGYVLLARGEHLLPIMVESPWSSKLRWWEPQEYDAGTAVFPLNHHVQFVICEGQVNLVLGDCGSLVVIPVHRDDSSPVLLPIGTLSLYDEVTRRGRGSSILTIMSFFLKQESPTLWEGRTFSIYHPSATELRERTSDLSGDRPGEQKGLEESETLTRTEE